MGLVKKALPTLLREAAAALGIEINAVYDPALGGRLMYRLGSDPAAPLTTPGETAALLGVVWP